MAFEGYWAILEDDPDDNDVYVSFREHPNIITYGTGEKHAIEMAEDALNVTLEYEFEKGYEVPETTRRPRVGAGKRAVFVPLRPAIRMAFLLRKWRKEAGFTQSRMARALGVTYQSYQRMEKPGRANITIEMLDRVAHALGKKAVVELR
ncbi:helix-turn-helix domain-containing protein [bacterium]|nr:helix-turn-helix domain-containing protein [bacterium]